MNQPILLPVVDTTPSSIGQLVNNICNSSTQRTTTVIACCTKAYFFMQLVSHLTPQANVEANDDRQQPPDSAVSKNHNVDSSTQTSSTVTATKLPEPTLRMLATSLNTQIVFCPSIPTFRAYLSTFGLKHGADDEFHTLVVLDMLALHHGTSEFTIQGLSRSFAIVASVNHRQQGNVKLVECTDANDASSPHKGSRLWNTEVPLLSGSIKIGEAGQGWANRTTNIRRFAERWFVFS